MLLLLLFAQFAGLSGTVRDAKTGEVLPYAHVYLEDTSLGTTTDERGFFSLKSIPPGVHTIAVSYIGYKTKRETLSFSPDTHIVRHYYLIRQEIQTEEVIVTARRERFKEEVIPHLKINTKDIELVPKFLEGDLLRSLQVLPGVITLADFSGRYSVRGGGPQENLTILDGMPLYNPYHLGGIFSTFDLDALESFDFYRGGYSASMGGALSSLLEAELKSGRKDRLSLTTSLSLLSTKVFIEGPLLNWSGILSLRRTYFDLIIPKIKSNWRFPYHFSDILFKTGRFLSNNIEFSLQGIWSSDVFKFEDDVFVNWGNRGFSLKTNFIKENLLIRNTISYVFFRSKLEIGDYLSLDNPVSITSFRLDGDYRLKDINYSGGIEFQRLYGRFTNDIFGLKEDDEGSPYLVNIYGELTLKGSRFTLNPGLRGTYFYLDFPPKPERSARRYSIEPRFSLKYFLREDSDLHLGVGLYTQYLVAITGFSESVASFYYWTTIFGKWKPMKALHYILGFDRLYSWGELNLDLFYKFYPYLLQYNRDNYDPLDPDNTVFLAGKGESYGIDLRISKSIGPIKGSISGSLLKAHGRFGNESYYHPLPWDRKGQFNLYVEIPIGQWGLGLNFTYAGGNPYTGVQGRYRKYYPTPAGDTDELPNFGRWAELRSGSYGLRYPDYNRMDLLIKRGFGALGGQWELILSIINLYNRKNVFMYYYDYQKDPPIRKTIPQLPIIPSVEIRGSW